MQPSASPYTYMNWKRELRLSKDEVDAVRKNDHVGLAAYGFGSTRQCYSVKQVSRQIDDPLRGYIRGLR